MRARSRACTASEAGSLVMPMPYSWCWIDCTTSMAASIPCGAASSEGFSCGFLPRCILFLFPAPGLGEATPSPAGGGGGTGVGCWVDPTLRLDGAAAGVGVGGGAMDVVGAERRELCSTIACCTALSSSGWPSMRPTASRVGSCSGLQHADEPDTPTPTVLVDLHVCVAVQWDVKTVQKCRI